MAMKRDVGAMMPGLGSEITDTPRRVVFKDQDIVRDAVVVSSAARDAGASRTTKLRGGLVLGIITASGKYAQYDNSASDGTQTAVAILDEETDLLDENATAQDATVRVIMSGGLVDQDQCIGLDSAAKTDLKGNGMRFKETFYAA